MILNNILIKTPVLLFVLFTSTLFAQNNNESIAKRFSIGLGGIVSGFQDVKYSNLQYLGVGPKLDLNFLNIKTKSIWGVGINSFLSLEQPSTFTIEEGVTTIGVNISAKYLRAIKTIADSPLYVGLTLDLPDFYFKTFGSLSNNKIRVNTSTNIKLSAMYIKHFSDKINLETGLDVQLLAAIKDITSFAFSAPQTLLENGQFTYQDSGIIFPYRFEGYDILPLWKYFGINTAIRLNYKEKWALSYKWNYILSARVENYPLHIGSNSLTITYNIINKK